MNSNRKTLFISYTSNYNWFWTILTIIFFYIYLKFLVTLQIDRIHIQKRNLFEKYNYNYFISLGSDISSYPVFSSSNVLVTSEKAKSGLLFGLSLLLEDTSSGGPVSLWKYTITINNGKILRMNSISRYLLLIQYIIIKIWW